MSFYLRKSIKAGPFRYVLLVYEGKRQVGAVRYNSLMAVAEDSRLVCPDAVPRDAQMVGHTWLRVNKSGGPDRRFRDNRQVPIIMQSTLRLQSGTGLEHVFSASRAGQADGVASAIQALADAAVAA